MRCPASLRNRLASDDGSVTIEAAFGLAGIVVVAGTLLSAMVALALYISAVDMAGAAARAHALGETFTPGRGAVELTDDGTWATATVTIPSPLMELTATATYPLEIVHAQALP